MCVCERERERERERWEGGDKSKRGVRNSTEKGREIKSEQDERSSQNRTRDED